MSEDSDYYSNSDSESDTETETEILNKKPLFKPSVNIKPYEDEKSDDEVDDADNDEIDDADNDEDVEGENVVENDEDDDDDYSVNDESSDEEKEEEEDHYDKDGNAILKEPVKSKKTKKTPIIIDNDDDDDDFDESYLQKFDNEITKNYIEEFHPECLNHNYDEIAKLSIVIKNSDGIIVDPLHKTIPFLTKYEKARILGQRSKQIETGSRPYVKVPENIIDGYIIAELELKEKKIPFIIKRPIPGGAFEYWNLKDLENISF